MINADHRRLGAEMSYQTPAEFGPWLAKENARWRPVVESAGMFKSQ